MRCYQQVHDGCVIWHCALEKGHAGKCERPRVDSVEPPASPSGFCPNCVYWPANPGGTFCDKCAREAVTVAASPEPARVAFWCEPTPEAIALRATPEPPASQPSEGERIFEAWRKTPWEREPVQPGQDPREGATGLLAYTPFHRRTLIRLIDSALSSSRDEALAQLAEAQEALRDLLAAVDNPVGARLTVRAYQRARKIAEGR